MGKEELAVMMAQARSDRELEELRATNLALRLMLAQVSEGLRHG